MSHKKASASRNGVSSELAIKKILGLNFDSLLKVKERRTYKCGRREKLISDEYWALDVSGANLFYSIDV